MTTEAGPIIDRQDKSDRQGQEIIRHQLQEKEGAPYFIREIRNSVTSRALEGLLERDALSPDKQEDGFIIKGTAYSSQTEQALDFNTTIDLSHLPEKEESKLQRDLWIIRNFNKQEEKGKEITQAQRKRVEASTSRTEAIIGRNITVETSTSKQSQTKLEQTDPQEIKDNNDPPTVKKKKRKGLRIAATSLVTTIFTGLSFLRPDTQAQAEYDEKALEQNNHKVVQPSQDSLFEETHSEIESQEQTLSQLFGDALSDITALQINPVDVDDTGFSSDSKIMAILSDDSEGKRWVYISKMDGSSFTKIESHQEAYFPTSRLYSINVVKVGDKEIIVVGGKGVLYTSEDEGRTFVEVQAEIVSGSHDHGTVIPGTSNIIYRVGGTSNLVIFNAETGKYIETSGAGITNGHINVVNVSPDGNQCEIYGAGGTSSKGINHITISNIKTGQATSQIEHSDFGRVIGLDATKDGDGKAEKVIVTTTNGFVKVFDIDTPDTVNSYYYENLFSEIEDIDNSFYARPVVVGNILYLAGCYQKNGGQPGISVHNISDLSLIKKFTCEEINGGISGITNVILVKLPNGSGNYGLIMKAGMLGNLFWGQIGSDGQAPEGNGEWVWPNNHIGSKPVIPPTPTPTPPPTVEPTPTPPPTTQIEIYLPVIMNN